MMKAMEFCMKTDILGRLLHDAARVRARKLCHDGWATISEEDLAKSLHDFSGEMNAHLVEMVTHWMNAAVDAYMPPPIIIQQPK